MEKIYTIFDRDWDGHRGVIDAPSKDAPPNLDFFLRAGFATEKIDGTNVRLTVRNGELVRIEKRRNPDKAQKKRGIKEPWYIDAFLPGVEGLVMGSENQYIVEAAMNTVIEDLPDGEYSGEAIGPKIQGNPLRLDQHVVVLFSVPNIRRALTYGDCPITFDELREWLPRQKSLLNPDVEVPIEGIVWWTGSMPDSTPIGKIKVKDFR